MQITMTFNSWEELETFKCANNSAEITPPTICSSTSTPLEAPQKAPKEKAGVVIPSDGEKPVEPTPINPKCTEKDRVKVRKMLAEINKKAGHNRAAEIIKTTTNVDKLTNVSLDDLPALMARAEEELNDAQ